MAFSQFGGRCKSGMASNQKRCDTEQSEAGGTGRGEMEHRTTALCSLGDRQECLPYLTRSC